MALKRKAEALAQPVSPVVGSAHEAGERLHAKQPKVELRVPRTGDPGRCAASLFVRLHSLRLLPPQSIPKL